MAHPRARAHAENTIEARPAAVYAVLADYSSHHPRIMPASFFSNLEVEAGGVGAGTVFHITFHMLGKRQQLHMQVAEPVPGHVLTETNLDTGAVTAFTVASEESGSRTRVQITSESETGGGLRGLIDRLATPVLMRRIFTRQLRELDRYMHSMEASKERPPFREGG
jgi:hypothetical protein